MDKNPRCLFESDFKTFLEKDKESIFGKYSVRFNKAIRLGNSCCIG